MASEVSTGESSADQEPIQTRPSMAGTWAALALVVIAVVLGMTFDFLAAGDGAVGVASESVRVATVHDAGDSPVTYVEHQPGATLTIGFPIRNRAFVPVTVTALEPATDADPPGGQSCVWQRTAVGGRRESLQLEAAPAQPLAPIRVPGGANVQLYVAATFPDGECAAPAGDEATRDSFVVSYRVLGVLPRRQVIPTATKITTSYDPDDPRLTGPEELGS